MSNMKNIMPGPKTNIAVIMADTEGPYNNQIWTELQAAARQGNVNLVVFEGRSIDQGNLENQHNFIYDLAQKYPCDGYIIFSSLIANYTDKETLIRFTQQFTKQSVPVISMSMTVPDAINVLVDNRTGMQELVSHCIHEHQYKRFAYIGGPRNHEEANERYQVFLDELTKNKIEIDPELVFYGDFSPSAGQIAVKTMHENGLLPVDCIICANDEAAMGVFTYLRQQMTAGKDISIPAVTGFDNTKTAQISRPGITTVAQPFYKMFYDVIKLIDSGSEHHMPHDKVYGTELVVRESCGCHISKQVDFSDELFLRATRNVRVHQYIQTFSMTDLFAVMSSILDHCGIGDCYIVLYDEPVIYPKSRCVSEKSHLIYAWEDHENRTTVYGNTSFPTSQLLPDNCKLRCRDKNIFVKPLFFINEHLGYIVIEPTGEDTRNFEPLRGQISNSLKIIAQFIEQNEISRKLVETAAELRRHNEKLSVLSLRDELTGLYNRRGFRYMVNQSIEQQSQIQTSSLLVYVDIDRMKLINDVYGHAAGDVAIRMTASVLRMAVRDEDIVARVGGDEFIILIRHFDADKISVVRQRINSLLDQYNERSNHEWELGISAGILSFDESKDKDIEELMKQADRLLYKEKKQKKRMQS